MKNSSRWKTAVVVLFGATMAIGASAQAFETLVNFNATNGATPEYLSLVQGTDGNFYGTTADGGEPGCSGGLGCGTVFKISPHGTLATLHNFCEQASCPDGENPASGVILASDGNLYGTTVGGGEPGCVNGGGCGTVFKLTPGGTLTTLYRFCIDSERCTDGANPFARLVQANDGNFYGTASSGGANGYGAVFRITPAGKLTTLYSFCSQPGCTDGYSAFGWLIQARDGNFYGTTPWGGADVESGGEGTVFKMTPRGELTTLYSFCPLDCSDGAYPFAGLVQGKDGNFYGTTAGGGKGGAGGGGTAFRISSSGTLMTLYNFCSEINCSDGAAPKSGVTQASDGRFYGTASVGRDSSCNPPYGCGTVFRLTRSGGILTTLHRFDGADGNVPLGGLLQATSGSFYGTSSEDGSNGCMYCGTVFGLDQGLGPFVSLGRYEGKVGDSGRIFGQGFTGTTSVLLNGIPASFTVKSDTYIRATVPVGATSGFVTVVAPSGTLISNKPFRVRP